MLGLQFHRVRCLHLAFIAFCAAGPDALAETVYRIGNVGEPGSLDPGQISTSYENRIVGDMFMGLVTEAADGRVVPGAAESWVIDDDGRTYTFTLRRHNWSDGTPVTGEDFVFALRRIVDPGSAAPYAFQLYPIRNAERLNSGALQDMAALGVSAPDPQTLRITLERPTPYFLGELTSFATYPVPEHVVERLGNGWAKPGEIVGNGAFIVKEWVPQTQVVSEKNPNFYDAENVAIDKVIYYSDENQEALLKRFRAGEIDYAANFPSTEIGWLREHLPSSVRINTELGINYYAVNTRRAPLGDVRVRRALSMAVDREAITGRMLKTGEVPAYSFVPPGTSNYGEPTNTAWRDMSYEQRLATARQLMEDAGYGPDHRLRLTIKYNTSETYKMVAVAVLNMWHRLGVDAALENSEVKVHYNLLEQGDFDIGRAGWIADYDDAQSFLLMFQSRAGTQNYGRYSNPDYDRIMESAAVTLDPRVRSDLLHRAEQMVLDDAAAIPIMYYVSKSLVQPYVQGWQPNVRNVHRARYISLAK